MFRPSRAAFTVALGLATAIIGSAASLDAAAKQYLREQRTVSVHAAKETWRLVWNGRPSTVCGPNEIFSALTCPCWGFAYAEYGKLFLVRMRDRHEVERMDLGPLFDNAEHPPAGDTKGMAYLQRWPTEADDLKRADRDDPGLISEIRHRPAPTIIRPADYDRSGDGATEFLIQVGTLPCGKVQFAAVGVSAKQPHLHALTSVAHPDTPLIMPLNAWQALLKSADPTTVRTWDCYDHGSDIQTDLIVSASNGELRVKEREFSCPSNGSAGKLIRETDR